jgi:hypothetical protein
MNRNPFGEKLWIAAVVLLFSIAWRQSGIDVYVDGDDAASMAYHIAGRDETLQPPYTPYHGMMDRILGFLPAREELVRPIAFGATRLASILMVVLILAIVFDWLRAGQKEHSPAWHVIASLLVLLAAPELFYFGLVYAPTFVAMCFILSAHIVLRWTCRDAGMTVRRRLFWNFASIVLFGFGVAFRWNTITYGIVIAVDLLTILPASHPFWRRAGLAAGWGALALFSSLSMISLSGYGIGDLVDRLDIALYVMNQAGTLSPESEASLAEALLRTVLTLTPLFTPAFGLLVLLGLVKFARERSPLVPVILVGMISVLPWLRSGAPKFMITAVPLFVFAFVAGFDMLAGFAERNRKKAPVYISLLLVLIIPWVVGIRIKRGGTAWGPGFEIKPYDYRDVSGLSVGADFGAGAAFPTPEGPRPLFGHAHVLLGGWANFVSAQAEDDNRAVESALSLGIPVVSTGWCPDWYLIAMYSRGYTTTEPARAFSSDGYFHKRAFRDAQGNTFTVLDVEVEGSDITDLVYYLKNTE